MSDNFYINDVDLPSLEVVITGLKTEMEIYYCKHGQLMVLPNLKEFADLGDLPFQTTYEVAMTIMAAQEVVKTQGHNMAMVFYVFLLTHYNNLVVVHDESRLLLKEQFNQRLAADLVFPCDCMVRTGVTPFGLLA